MPGSSLLLLLLLLAASRLAQQAVNECALPQCVGEIDMR